MKEPVAFRNISRLPAEIAEAFEGYGVSTVHEAQGRKGLLAPYLRPIFPGTTIAGSAVTVSVPPADNLTIHAAVEFCSPGDILVVAPTSPCSNGYFGELLATSLRARSVKGLVIDAGCRDVQALKNMGFPVWSRLISSQGTVKESLGSINVPVVCAGATVTQGDLIIADDDGVCVVKREQVTVVQQQAKQRIKREGELRERLAAGELGVDIYDLRQKIAKLGLKYI